jgi:UDP-N-acetylmuramoylalanine-D-glutamate ligase
MRARVEVSRACRTRSNASPKSTRWRSSNDSKATNIASARRCARKFSARRGGDHGRPVQRRRLRDLRRVASAHSSGIVAIGEAAPLVEQALGAIRARATRRSMDDAVDGIRDGAPAAWCCWRRRASSFDMFRDYVDRGDRFRDAVHELARAFDSHQTGRGGEEPAAGNTGRSGL